MPAFDEVWTSIAPLWAALSGDARDRLAASPEEAGEAAVFRIATSEVDEAPALPEGADLVEAPLGAYDIVELTLFGRPAAKARIAFGNGIAAVGRFEFEPGQSPDQLGPGLLSALAQEAFAEGAETIYTVADGTEQPPYLGPGWTEAGRLRRA
ncbi:hypothetical protein SPF06_06275 [Sinomonas sp. JGH33]|uniref:Uncharacterized protein n=1 Tax=Sinomonas terricola TaxID=3110330 RepID=A0ABU5T3S3_9MICC|nr:hypothetical protein [Sinomonas sp. JGH33]MEA5454323.1 hypothetical protein [Sinomonas sp. JGH33]